MISKNAMFPKQGNFENFGEELHRAEIPEYMQKTAALYFCTPDL